ncbi:MAG: CHAT domain-containing protein [Muribaculaceae bacterium]|nr:CHAT domain-containing protein [Muribaculaceae bacterium]
MPYSDIDLGNLVWSPIIGELPPGTSDIFFAPEGIFHLWGIENMPFDGKEALRLHRVTSTADISNRNLGIKDSTSMLLIGGLNYSAIPSEGESTERNHLAGETLKRKVGTTNVFKYLPATRSEVDSINNSFGNATILYHAPEGELKRMMPEFKTLHIATHGYSLNLGIRKRPEYLADSLAYDSSLQACALALTGANHLFETGQREDGLLSAREICDLDLSNVDFVILSACQTAQGNVTDEGAAGLVRGLKNAGVKTVMATLWPVDDRSTMIFMNKFYNLLHQGCSKYEAFVGAQDYLKGYEKRVPLRKFSPSTLAHEQKSVYNSVKYDSPYYWAPFIIIDD